MIIGVDLDNTIVCYDTLFLKIAKESNLIAHEMPATKKSVRDYLRQTGRENAWTELQGYVYGEGMKQAVPFEGAYDFFTECAKRKIPVFIISHRTPHPVSGKPFDLHHTASLWLKQNSFYDTEKTGLSDENVFFEQTQEEKIKRILAMQCDFFIDDLYEFLTSTDFPPLTKKILFDPHNRHASLDGIVRAASWKDMQEIILKEAVFSS